MKRDAFHHTKMQRLLRRLDLPRFSGVGLLETLWYLTSTQAPRGDIGSLSNESIAIGLDYRADEEKLIQVMVSIGWLDRHPQHRLLIHDWPDHCDDSVHKKLARAREYFADGTTPKYNRLPRDERAAAKAFYDNSGRPESQSGRPDQQNGRPERQSGRPGPRFAHATGEQEEKTEQKGEEKGIIVEPQVFTYSGRPESDSGRPDSPNGRPKQPNGREPRHTTREVLSTGSSSVLHQSSKNSSGGGPSAFVEELMKGPPPNGKAQGQNTQHTDAEFLERYETAKQWLLNFPGANRLPGVPDDEIIRRCLKIVEHDVRWLGEALHDMAVKGKTPSISWAWFPKVLSQYIPPMEKK